MDEESRRNGTEEDVNHLVEFEVAANLFPHHATINPVQSAIESDLVQLLP